MIFKSRRFRGNSAGHNVWISHFLFACSHPSSNQIYLYQHFILSGSETDLCVESREVCAGDSGVNC